MNKRKLPTPVADVPKMSSSTSGKFSNIDQICYCRTMQRYMLLFEDIYYLDMIIFRHIFLDMIIQPYTI